MRRTYTVTGRYGYWAVDEHNDQDGGVTDTLTALPSRKLATAIADALTRAYENGQQDAAAVAGDCAPDPTSAPVRS